MQETGLDRGTLNELYQVFYEELVTEKIKLLRLYSENDMGRFQKVIHNIKGISGSYKASILYEQACLIDSNIKSGAFDNIGNDLSGLISKIDCALSDIRKNIEINIEKNIEINIEE